MIHEDPDDKLPDDVDFGIDSDEDDGSTPEAAEVAEPPAEPAKPPAKPEKSEAPADVPYGRFKEVIDERNRARDASVEKDRELADLRARVEKPEPAKPDPSLAEKIRAQHAALLQGDEEAAERIGLELEALREERATNLAMARMEAKENAASLKAQEAAANAAAVALIEAHDVLNSESDKFDAELFEDFKSLADRYAKTMPVAEAFKRAEERLLGTPEPKPTSKAGTSRAFQNAQIAARIPPSLSSAGTSNANAAVSQFSAQSVRKIPDKVFRDMSPEEKDVLLGNA